MKVVLFEIFWFLYNSKAHLLFLGYSVLYFWFASLIKGAITFLQQISPSDSQQPPPSTLQPFRKYTFSPEVARGNYSNCVHYTYTREKQNTQISIVKSAKSANMYVRTTQCSVIRSMKNIIKECLPVSAHIFLF